jgi:malate dehydrogenase (oxaloacetate-decarboxylating)(NADP+)
LRHSFHKHVPIPGQNRQLNMDEQLHKAALDYHRLPSPGKISVQPTKAMSNQRDLSLAYSPGVAAACTAIAREPELAGELTSRSNLVAVVTNGSAVLGLGNIGALAGKPVMEGKGCLFKKFAGIDVFDIEIDEQDPDRLVEIIASMEPTFGGINLEDIQAPQCFAIERKLRERMKIPVFHDDQHGTAIIVGAAVLNALEIVGKPIEHVRLVCSGAGAAAIACLDQLVGLGVKRENIWVSDSVGVVFRGRNQQMDPEKERYAQPTDARSLGEIIPSADIFLGLSAGNVLTPDMLKAMAERPIVLALANPDPEIRPEYALETRPDIIIATGRSDYPNQVNNVLCFPFIFRGALDVGATTINEAMKIAALRAIADLARAEPSDALAAAYGQEDLTFGPGYLIPRPFDPRLITSVAPAVARAAMESGVTTRKIADLDAYRRQLQSFVYYSGSVMQPVFAAAATKAQRVLYADGEDSRVLRAAQIVADEKLAYPVLLGRTNVIEVEIRRLGLRLRTGKTADIIDTAAMLGGNNTLLATSLLNDSVADALICGCVDQDYAAHLECITEAPGHDRPTRIFAAMNLLMLPKHTIFICDTYVNQNPDADELAAIAVMAAVELRHFGLIPRVAFAAPATSGPTSLKIQAALALLRAKHPDLLARNSVESDIALSSGLTSETNILVMPNLDVANITFNMLKAVSGEGVTIGPILLGTDKPAHILTPEHTVRGIVNMSALAAVQAAHRRLAKA